MSATDFSRTLPILFLAGVRTDTTGASKSPLLRVLPFEGRITPSPLP